MLEDRVALVTGGGRGLGQAFALALAQAGARVAVLARSAEQLACTVEKVEQAGGRALAVAADVTKRAAVEQAVAAVQAHLGPVEVLVNNAGTGGPVGPIWEVDPAAWWRCVEVHVKGALLCACAVLPGMVARRSGRIINISSAVARGAAPHQSAYVTSKTAVTRLTEAMAAELAEHNVRVFAIEPGTVRTAMTEKLMESPYMAPLQHTFAVGHDVPPQRAADLVVWLAGGRGDPLSGLLIGPRDDVHQLLARQHTIRRLGLHTLRVTPFGRRTVVAHAVSRALDWWHARRGRRNGAR
ncbi:MAG: SDR family oxidoreductase [Candidatus Latescibacterota bacterium]